MVAGPDISTVKFQKFSEVGLQAGVLLGYAVSNRFAIEAGALWGGKITTAMGRISIKINCTCRRIPGLLPLMVIAG
jgi:hypothetical protein